MIALLDSDLLAYRCAASAENDPVEVAIQRHDELFEKLLLETEAEEYKAFLTGEGNFRKTLFPEYKAHRTQPKPIHLQALRNHAVDKWKAEVVHGFEADDALAWSQTKNTCIVSLDKDLLQIPGKHYSWEIRGINKGTEWLRPATWHNITEVEGFRRLYTQGLTGDKTDNIPGIAGIGEKKALKLLEGLFEEQELFDAVRDAYGNDDEFNLNMSCLYILRSKEDSWEKQFERLSSKKPLSTVD